MAVISRFFLNRPASQAGLPKLRSVPQGFAIPKIIHQTSAPPPWPDEIANNVFRTRQINSTWEYRFYSDEDQRAYIKVNYGTDILRYYDKINPLYGAARADLFRYLALYLDGGVYLDIKSGSFHAIDESIDLNNAHYVLSRWANRRGDQYDDWGIHSELERFGGEEFQQWNIISEPGHPFLRSVILTVLRNIKYYNPLIHYTGTRAVINVTGPITYTIAIYPLLRTAAHTVLTTEQTGLYYNIFDETGGGNKGHTGNSHYSRLAGQSVVKVDPITMFLFRCKRRWDRMRSASPLR